VTSYLRLLRDFQGVVDPMPEDAGVLSSALESRLSAIRRQSVRETAVLWQVVGAPFRLRMYYHVLDR